MSRKTQIETKNAQTKNKLKTGRTKISCKTQNEIKF